MWAVSYHLLQEGSCFSSFHPSSLMIAFEYGCSGSFVNILSLPTGHSVRCNNLQFIIVISRRIINSGTIFNCPFVNCHQLSLCPFWVQALSCDSWLHTLLSRHSSRSLFHPGPWPLATVLGLHSSSPFPTNPLLPPICPPRPSVHPKTGLQSTSKQFNAFCCRLFWVIPSWIIPLIAEVPLERAFATERDRKLHFCH